MLKLITFASIMGTLLLIGCTTIGETCHRVCDAVEQAKEE